MHYSSIYVVLLTRKYDCNKLIFRGQYLIYRCEILVQCTSQWKFTIRKALFMRHETAKQNVLNSMAGRRTMLCFDHLIVLTST